MAQRLCSLLILNFLRVKWNREAVIATLVKLTSHVLEDSPVKDNNGTDIAEIRYFGGMKVIRQKECT